MTAEEFEDRITGWARRQPDMVALIKIGSRAKVGVQADDWADWDYQLVVRDPRRYHNREWPAEIAPLWVAHYEKTSDHVVKLGGIFAGGREVDFVLIAAWKIKLVYWAMARPGARRFYPRALVNGIYSTQQVVGPAYRIILGGAAWERRLAAFRVPWPERQLTAGDFLHSTSAFWRHAVWLLKKIGRGELRSAARWYTAVTFDHVYILLAEEARLAERSAVHLIRPGDVPARRAERWLSAKRLRQTEITTAPDQQVMARALGAALDLFEEVSASVAKQRGFPPGDYSAVAAWLRAELAKLAG